MSRRRMELAIGTLLTIGLVGFVGGEALHTSARAATQGENILPTLVGTIRTADGAPLEGVAVSARAVTSTVTRTVFTDQAGEFFFPTLEDGQYRVWAQATGFDAARAELTLDPARTTRQAFTMAPLADITMQLMGSEWLASLPSATKEQRRMREIFRSNCALCHSTSVILQQKFDEAGWNAIVEFMLERHVTGVPRQLGLNRWSTIAHHQAEIVEYLASVRGPDSPPLEYVVNPRPTGEAARVLITEYDIPAVNEVDGLAWFTGSDWQAGAGTSGARGAIHDVVVDAAGDAWLNSLDRFPNRVAVKLDPETGQVTAFTAPGVAGGGRILVDPQGTTLWLDVRLRTQAPRVQIPARIDPVEETLEPFAPTPGMSTGLAAQMAPDDSGKVWLATQFGGIHLDPDTKQFRLFLDATLHDGFTYGVAVDRRGNGWFAKYAADKIGFAEVKSGKTYEIDMRPPWLDEEEDVLTAADRAAYDAMGVGTWGGINMVPGRQAPRRLGYDPNADVVWVANNNGDTVVGIDAKTRVPTYYRTPRPVAPYRVDVDNDGNAYVASLIDDVVLKLNPTTGQWTTYRMPTNGCQSRSIFVDRRRTEVWLPCDSTARVARVQFRTAAQIQALKDASAEAGQ